MKAIFTHMALGKSRQSIITLNEPSDMVPFMKGNRATIFFVPNASYFALAEAMYGVTPHELFEEDFDEDQEIVFKQQTVLMRTRNHLFQDVFLIEKMPSGLLRITYGHHKKISINPETEGFEIKFNNIK